MGCKMDPVWLLNYLMLPQGPQIAKIVYYLTLWVIYEKLVVHCFPCYSYICSVTRSSLADTWYLQMDSTKRSGLPGHPKHECYILHVYLYLYKTRIDGTINCKLVYMVTAVTYKLRGTMIPCGGGGSHQTTNAILYRARERQEACRPDSSAIYNWFSGHKKNTKSQFKYCSKSLIWPLESHIWPLFSQIHMKSWKKNQK